MKRIGRFLLWVLAYIVTIWLLLMAAGCTERTQGRVGQQTFITDPSSYALAPMQGRWENTQGWRLDCGETIYNGFGPLRFWTCWPTSGYYKQPSQKYNATVVYDLVMNTDSSAVGFVQFVGYRTYWKDVLKDPLPDSLSSVIFSIRAQYRSLDSLWTGYVGEYDTLLGDYPRIYDVQPAWRCTLWAEGVKIYPAYAYARLTRYTSPSLEEDSRLLLQIPHL